MSLQVAQGGELEIHTRMAEESNRLTNDPQSDIVPCVLQSCPDQISTIQSFANQACSSVGVHIDTSGMRLLCTNLTGY